MKKCKVDKSYHDNAVVHIKDFHKYYDKAVIQYLNEKGMTEHMYYYLRQEQKNNFMHLLNSDDVLMSSIGIEYYADVIEKIMNEIYGEGDKICKHDMDFLEYKFKEFHDLFTRKFKKFHDLFTNDYDNDYDGGKRRKTKITKKKKRSKITGARCCTRRSRRTSCRRGETAHRR